MAVTRPHGYRSPPIQVFPVAGDVSFTISKPPGNDEAPTLDTNTGAWNERARGGFLSTTNDIS